MGESGENKGMEGRRDKRGKRGTDGRLAPLVELLCCALVVLSLHLLFHLESKILGIFSDLTGCVRKFRKLNLIVHNFLFKPAEVTLGKL